MNVKLIKAVNSPLGVRKRIQKRLAGRPRLSQRLKDYSLAAMLPNLTTIMALCAGLTSVRFALSERWEMAVTAILVAALLDAMDGRLARMLGSTSRFGAELDSFADFVSFGISPALVMYFLSLRQLEGTGWAIVLFFSVCMALRLARFNTRSIEGLTPSWSQAFFIGVPAPAAAILAITPLIMHLEWKNKLFIHPIVVACVMVVVGGLMVSQVPTYSFKTVKIPYKWVRPFLLIVTLLVASLFNAPWLTLIIIACVYVATLPFSFRSYLQQKPKE
jgi:CDP-diacylglycerol--serine O-phosphatidyltransferase